MNRLIECARNLCSRYFFPVRDMPSSHTPATNNDVLDTNARLFRRVQEGFAVHLGLDKNVIKEERTFKDIGADAIDRLELAWVAEEIVRLETGKEFGGFGRGTQRRVFIENENTAMKDVVALVKSHIAHLDATVPAAVGARGQQPSFC